MTRFSLVSLILLGAISNAPAQTFTPSANCSLGTAAFCETFDQGPAANRGRGGDLDTSKWGTARLSGEITSSGNNTANPVQTAPIPACRAGITQTSVFPPSDTLICDAVGAQSRRLMTAVSMKNYGVNSHMIRQPFDFAGRTGKIVFDASADQEWLGGYIEIEVTEDPTPATTFREFQNFEVGPVPRNGLSIKFAKLCGASAAPWNTMVYANYVGTIIQPTFNHDNGCASLSPGNLNHFEVRLSQNHIDVYGSDFSTDQGQTFPNFRLLYSADISLPFTRGYVHVNPRNHASDKYGFGPDAIFYWDNIGFDGPVVAAPRAYEVLDNTTSLTYDGQPAQNLGWQLQGVPRTTNPGIYDPTTRLSSLSLQGVDTSGAMAATLTLNAFFSAATGTANTSWGFSYRFNGGTLRNYNLTAGDLASINAIPAGPLGMLALAISIPVTDIVSGTNTLELLPLNAPQDYPPVVANIDLLLTAEAAPPPPPVNGACGSANGTTVASAPTTNLCSAGTASAVAGSGPWTWSCAGSNGGTTASCSANKTATPPADCTVKFDPVTIPTTPGPFNFQGSGTINCP